MKKGNANWLAEREREAQDMRERGIRSYRQYREQLTLEQQTQRIEQRHERWQRDRLARRIKALEESMYHKTYTTLKEMYDWTVERLQQRRASLVMRKLNKRRVDRELKKIIPNYQPRMRQTVLNALNEKKGQR
jgi:hypothetical protein